MTSRPPNALKQNLGVGTSTPVAFMAGGVLYMERMSVITEDGCGILCPTLPKLGDVVPLVFRLSTAKDVVRCKGEVVGDVPTTPAGVELRKKVGVGAFQKVATAGMGDSATVMFRMSDLEAQAKRDKKASAERPIDPPAGFTVRFVEMTAADQELVRRHLSVSQRMSEQLAVRGERVLELGENERETMQQLLGENDISKKALDW